MTEWTAFVAVTTVVLFLLLTLARLSQSVGSDRADETDADAASPAPLTESTPGLDVTAAVDRDAQYAPLEVGRYPDAPSPAERTVAGLGDPDLPTAALLLNVALSQGVLGAFLLFGAFYASVPLPALGVDLADPLSTGLPALGVGVGVGVGLYLVNVAGAAAAAAAGFEYDESLRDVLTPASRGGWGLLLLAVLPLIAGFEELLFRAALVGAFGEGLALSPWLLAVVSSIAFAFGHGAQGRMGMLVTGVLGFVLAVVFVLTNSLLAVVVAHYLVNALEFVVGGYLGVEWH
ncbi:CPBP family intramembrane glutamic endopeptidase [Halomarina oriensis]|uniref:CPBP family intramembrane metalloprotease n=1 Tax=Halomarina oriensis TaxID=671145 RepID=A0A6B0GPZ5_9EURY|nr:CPBP family intramembrane glutamic endopeptidase [Halomarina oriensis]MWG35447.1 CPBP family intramembrane metalloprotease [Halomarina oriensis]